MIKSKEEEILEELSKYKAYNTPGTLYLQNSENNMKNNHNNSHNLMITSENFEMDEKPIKR